MKKSSLEKLLKVHSELYDTEKKELIKDVIIAECGENDMTIINEDLKIKEKKNV